MKPQDFYTRARSNEGVRMPLTDRLGNVTDAWLLVRGFDSDAYRAAHDGYNRAMVRLAAAVRAHGTNAPLLKESQADKETAMLAERAALVAGWNLEGECTPEAALELLREAPYISDQVFYAAQDHDRFFGNSSAISTAGLSTNSASTGQQPTEQATP